MKIWQCSKKASWPELLTPSVVTIGNFDGLHLGHRALLDRVQKLYQDSSLAGERVLVTFDPHPVQVLHPQERFTRIFPVEDLTELLHGLIDHLIIQEFTLGFAKVSAGEFLDEYLLQKLSMQELVVGHDFCFGAGQEGRLDWLDAQAQEKNYRLWVQSAVELQGEVVSSTRLRRVIQEGRVEEARELLGRTFYSRGQVVRGDGRGHSIGFPTANLRLVEGMAPAQGVYMGRLRLLSKDQTWPCLINVGVNPTFQKDNDVGSVVEKIEAHVLDEQGLSLYGETVQVEYMRRLREERNFESVDALVSQIHLDISKAKVYFSSNDSLG